jgi:serine protease Do
MRILRAMARTFSLGTGLLALVVVGAWLAASAGSARAEGEVEARRNAIVRLVERARPAIVSVRTNQIVRRTWFDFTGESHHQLYEKDGGLGSGVVFHPDGYVITNAHVISRASSIFLSFGSRGEAPAGNGEREVRALPVAVDLANDLAILRIIPDPDAPAAVPYPHLELGTSGDVMLGETVIAIGHPFRLGFTVTQGIVSGTNRRLALGNHVFDDFMQVDAAINPGNSGGPLFDVTGRWIGVNTAIYNRAQLPAEGIGFAIPANRVRSLVAKAFKQRVVTGRWLGLEFEEGDFGNARVQEVWPKGPARDSGIKTGDVVVAVNGKPTPTLYDVRIALISADRGGTARLRLRREGAEVFEKAVPVEELPTRTLSVAHLGFVAEDKEDFDGIVVSSVREGGPAVKAGLRALDVVVALGRWKMRNTEDLLMFLQYVSPGDEVDIEVRRPLRDTSGRILGERALTGSLLAD